MSFGTEKGVGGLDGIDVLVEVIWQRPGRGTDEVASILMLVNRVLGVQQTLDGGDGQIDLDPIFGGCIAQLGRVDAVIIQPFMHLLQGFIARLDQLVDLGGGQVLAIACVGGVGHCDSYALECAVRHSGTPYLRRGASRARRTGSASGQCSS